MNLQSLSQQLLSSYREKLQADEAANPYQLAQEILINDAQLTADQLAELIIAEPRLLASRCENGLSDSDERENPSVGLIINASLVAIIRDEMFDLARSLNRLDFDDEGELVVTDDDLDSLSFVHDRCDFSQSDKALEQLAQRSQGHLSALMGAAENSYRKAVTEHPDQAYPLALKVSTDHSLFSPDDLAPLVAENPLLLGLREDGLLANSPFGDDPPAGVILSSHLTAMMIDQLLDIAVEEGLLAMDGSGQLILPDNLSIPSTLH